MTGLIIARAYEPGIGMCSVESIGAGWFRLIPDNNPLNRIVKPRESVRWRSTKKKETA